MQHVILDTDVFSNLAFARPQASGYSSFLIGKIPALTFTSVGEIYFGAYKAGWGERRVTALEGAVRRCVVLPYDANLPKLWGELRSTACLNGHALAHRDNTNDLWIAACAIYYQAPLLTANKRHFEGLPGLNLVDAA
ncbi:PIN domain-containing protein [Crossiella sp. CA198]|uniref:PIN domain-containing protein n=1 Tax=Crossiella sp. CA198 TaxID=3455607 RepID=UPI003F8D143A